MKNKIVFPFEEKIETNELHSLVDKLICSSLPIAIRKCCFFINEVSPLAKLEISDNIVALVLGNLLCDLIAYSENNCIRIGETETGTGIVVTIKNSDIGTNRAFTVSIETIQLIAERFGGNILITRHQSDGTLITINFKDSKIAA